MAAFPRRISPLNHPFHICSCLEIFKAFHFQTQGGDSISAYWQQLPRRAALLLLLLLLLPRDGEADNTHTN
jgi:hypothetical protein